MRQLKTSYAPNDPELARLVASGVFGAAAQAVITGTPYPGETLTSTITGQWAVDGVAIDGETGATLVVPDTATAGDLITCGNSNALEVIGILDYIDPYVAFEKASGVLESDNSAAEDGEIVTTWQNRGSYNDALLTLAGGPTWNNTNSRVAFSGATGIGMRSSLARFAYSTNIPDGAGETAGNGFTITGLCRASDGTWWAANHGQGLGSSVFATSLVHLSADFTTKLDEILLVPLFPSIGSIQGITLEADGSIWFASTDENKLRHVSTSGVDLGSINTASSPNALVYRASDNKLITGAGAAVNLYDATSGSLTGTLPYAAGMDHFHLCANGDLLATIGSNGSDAEVWFLHSGGTAWRRLCVLHGSLAVEGIYWDESANLLHIANDERYHLGAAYKNRIATYNVPPRYLSVVELHARVKLGTRAKTECFLGIGEPVDGSGFGLFVLSGNNTALRIFANTSSGTSQRVQRDVTVSNLTTESVIRVKLDLANDVISIWQNGTLISNSQSAAACGPEMLMRAVGIGRAAEEGDRSCSGEVASAYVTPALNARQVTDLLARMNA
jgi:hypothetical protein